MTIEQNFVFVHSHEALDTFDGLYAASNEYNTDFGRRTQPINLSLGDEPASADGQAHLANIKVFNNIFVGGKRGFLDDDDGTSGVVHGLKGCVIANNTFVIAAPTLAGQTGYGCQHTFANDASADSVFENNLMVTATADDRYASIDQHSGITVDYNLYSGLGVFAVGGVTKTFSEWGAATSFDAHSINADAMLVGAAEFNQTKAQKAVYDGSKAKPLTGSLATGAGTNLSATFSTDFTGASRASGAYEIGAVGH